MPYIDPRRREALEPVGTPETPGELNYVFTRLAAAYFYKRGNYAAINDVLGALEGAKLEFYRRVTVPYEERKRAENGDVY